VPLSDDALERVATVIADKVATRLARAHDDRPLLTPIQAAERLAVSERTLREMIAGDAPELPSVRVRGARRIEPAAIDALIAAQRIP
jgi:excisionase family DNA binding protein